MRGIILIGALAIGLIMAPPVYAEDGSLGRVEGLSVRPRGPHTEIAARVVGEADYRLFHRLAHPTEPRFTIVLSRASYELEERYFDSVMRGGVGGIEVRELEGDTVQIRIGLTAVSPYMLLQRDDEVILRIENPDGEFESWSTMMSRPATTQEEERGPPPTLGDAAPITTVTTVADASEEVPEDVTTDLEVASNELISDGLAESGIVSKLSPIQIVLAGSMAALGIITLMITRMRRRAGQRFEEPIRHRDRGPSRTSRVWAARTLAQGGATPEEIARKTGLSRDAIELILPKNEIEAQPGDKNTIDPVEDAGSGTFFRPHNPYANLIQNGVGGANSLHS